MVVAEMLQLEMAECPYCFHTWQSKVDWRLEKCPRCGQMVSRAMLDEKWD
ncbi:MAG: hypothetical protein ACE5PO_05670 [Candidatus Bathyarchaeia archaeon]